MVVVAVVNIVVVVVVVAVVFDAIFQTECVCPQTLRINWHKNRGLNP